MKKGNKTVLSLLITVVILAAMFSGFGIGFFASNTPQVVLPTAVPTQDADPAEEDSQGADGGLRVEVTPKTVQSVIATLKRPESYYREIVLETFWDGTRSETATAQVWVEGGYTRIDTILPGGTIEHTVIGDGYRYRWYNNERKYFRTEASANDADLMQRIPTYETILNIDPATITATGYEEKEGLPCIYVEVTEEELGYQERYWISVEWGLLAASETVRGTETVLRTSAYSVEIPVREGAAFVLPDGTSLYEG